MKFLPYVFKHLRRNWIRSSTTIAAIALCIFLFCTLRSVLAAIDASLESTNASRLVTRHAVSLAFNLPLSYKPRIAAVEGVERVATVSWFGGSLRAKRAEQGGGAEEDGEFDFSNFFPNMAVDPEEYLAMYPELMIPQEQREAWLADRRGALIGRGLAGRFGWTIGDTFFLESFIPPYRKPDGPFEFVVRAIYDTDEDLYPATDLGVMYFHFDYLYEATGRSVGAGSYTIEIADPDRAGAVSERIDALFENSDAQTVTETESAFRASFISMAGNLAFLLNSIALAVTFTILLVTANTMSMSVRERRTEIAVLKTLGFSSALVMSLILGEGLLVGAIGGGLGVGGGWGLLTALPHIPGLGDTVRSLGLGGLEIPPGVMLTGFGASLLIAFAAGAVPAWLAYRARITDTLRQV